MNPYFMKRILFGILIIFCFSCEEETNEIDFITGKWEWVRSWYGFAGHMYTPENTGISEIILITSDYTFKKYINDTLIIESGFTIKEPDPGYKRRYIDFDNDFTSYSYELFSKDSLKLMLRVTDGMTEYYHRVQ